MKATAQILVAFAPVILAAIFPFLRVLSGKSVWWAFALCWVSLIAWEFAFALIIPLAINAIDRDLGREIFLDWAPEGPCVVAMTFFGWLYAAITVFLAMLVRWIRQLLRKTTKHPNVI